MRYQYFVTPHFDRQVTGVFTQADAEAGCKSFQELLNHYTSHGWEYVRTEEVVAHVNTGCLAGLFGQGNYTTKYKQIVFRKPVPDSALSSESPNNQPA